MGVLKGRVRKSFIQPALFLTVGSPPRLVQISFLIKTKDGDHNFHEENPKHSLAKITPATRNCVLFSAHFINAVDLSFLSVYRRNYPRGMLEEHEKSLFITHRSRVID